MRKYLVPVLVVSGVLLGTAPTFSSEKICISTRDIASSQAEKGGAAILFKMRDGTQWHNSLKGKCPDLDFNGYAWTVRNPNDTVCENEQSLKVLRSAQVCQLGKFENVTPGHK